MKIILFEYMTGGGLCNQEIPNLANEGELMLSTISQELISIKGVTLTIMRDSRLPPLSMPVETIWVNRGDDFSMMLSDLLDGADAFWPIAPETSNVLSSLCRLAESKGCLLLNPSADTVNCFSSKLNTYYYLEDYQIDCVNTAPLESIVFPQSIDMVIKPDDGIGCEGAVLIPSGNVPNKCDGQFICQPYIEGITGSMGIVYSKKEFCLISVNRQNIIIDKDKFSLQSCMVNGLLEYRDEATVIAKRLRSACPGLCGYIGVDFVVMDIGIVILELNPRVTTSFIGLSESTGTNPCQLVIDAVQGKALNCPSQSLPVEIFFNE